MEGPIPHNIAHIRENGDCQSLEDHLRGTAELCSKMMEALNLRDVGRVMGLLHDIGKATDDFNAYISSEDSGFSRGELDHSTAGAQYLHKLSELSNRDSLEMMTASEMMELSILSHHMGLINCIDTDGKDCYGARINKNHFDTRFEEATNRVDQSILKEVESTLQSALSSLSDLIKKICYKHSDCGETAFFQMGLLNRMLLSCLIDADRIDTRSFQEYVKYNPPETDWNILACRFEEYISKFNVETRIGKIRSQISEECLRASASPNGIFTLSVPTGGGKTLSSLRFSLNHLIHNSMDRIIYVVPYLTIIEQNVDVIRKALSVNPDDVTVTECHSNADLCYDKECEKDIWSSPTDSWDSPIIFTSMIQFMDSIFGSGTKSVRRMHNLCNSIIIFDEIQSLPIKTIEMFNEAVNFLCEHCNTTAIMCTATQPLLGEVNKHPLSIGRNSEIISDVDTLFRNLRRTEVQYVNPTGPEWNHSDLAELAASELNVSDSVLVIVNTKKMAESVFRLLKTEISPDILLVHLSTNMCPMHRKTTLNHMIKNMGHMKILCISTQLIEAGVDVDFDVVIRSLAGLDSIAQAAGRCNRNGRKTTGKVLVARTMESISSLTDIREGRRCSETILNKFHEDILSPNAMKEYYSKYFFKRSIDMAYPSCIHKGWNLFDMLAYNSNGYRTCRKINGKCEGPLHQAFADANQEFKIIDETDSVIIPYDEISREMITVLCSNESYVERIHAIHILQRYSINTFALNRLLEKGIVKALQSFGSTIYCLVEGYYDKDIGMVEIAEQEPMIF